MAAPRTVTIKDSSQISNVSYDPSSKTMQIRFKNNTMYMYANVAPSIFGALISADSVGSYFARYVRHKYNGVKVELLTARRICAFCKTSFPMVEMLRCGKDYLCHDKLGCYRRRMAKDEACTIRNSSSESHSSNDLIG